jgi:uncharacterized membrane protein
MEFRGTDKPKGVAVKYTMPRKHTTTNTPVFGSEILEKLMASKNSQKGQEKTDKAEPGQQENSDMVEESIETIVAMHVHTEQNVNLHQRAIERITSAAGRPRFFYLTMLVIVAWVVLNLTLLVLRHAAIDPPPFYDLQGFVGLAALLITTMVLITQRRQSAKDERRMQLNLQINLISERKVTKLIELVEELRRDLPQVKNRRDPQAEAMKEYIDPHEVLRTLSQMLNEPVDNLNGE